MTPTQQADYPKADEECTDTSKVPVVICVEYHAAAAISRAPMELLMEMADAQAQQRT
jgi:hypothetical protein